MRKTLWLTAVTIALSMLASTQAFATPACGSEVCAEIFGFYPLTGAIAVGPAPAFVPKGPALDENAVFCLLNDTTFPPGAPPVGVIGRHYWVALLPPGGSIPADLFFLGTINDVPFFHQLPFVVPFRANLPLQTGSFFIGCFSQRQINEAAPGTYLIGGGYTVQINLPETLSELLVNAVSGVTTFFFTIGD